VGPDPDPGILRTKFNFSCNLFYFFIFKVEKERQQGQEVFVNLVVDEIKLHKQFYYKNGQFVGSVDLGDGQVSSEMATDAWVFMGTPELIFELEFILLVFVFYVHFLF